MAGNLKISDLVPQETLDELVNLRTEMGTVVTEYKKTARELAQGLQIKVEVVGDLDQLVTLVNAKTKEATEQMRRMAEAQAQYSRVIGQTTPVLSRQLGEVDKMNRSTQTQYDSMEKVNSMVKQYNDTIEQNAKRVAVIKTQMADLNAKMKDNEKAYKEGTMSLKSFREANGALLLEYEGLKQEKSKITQMMNAEIKMNQAGEESYNQLSQQFELLKKTYKDLDKETRESSVGQAMLAEINELDAHLKDLAGNMGEFQRNVGNYAIAGQNGVVATESLNAVLSQQAVTIQDVSDQTKILEEAKRMLNTADEKYPETVAAINAQLAQNRARLADVSDIMEKQPTTVHEAEEQNKRFAEALKLVDINSEGAREKIDALNARIAGNKELIEQNTKALKDNSNESKALADQVLGLIGINSNFGSSLTSLQTQGNVFDGLKTKVQAFGKTLTGLLANPWVLTFLGIAGVGAAVKWWYDYNKGLIEASKLTKNFTGETGEAMKHLRSEVQSVADNIGKDFKTTISSANTLVQQFGLNWDEAIGLMKDGIAAGADMNGNFLSMIERFAPAMRDAGVSASELVAILANTKNGIFDEKGVNDIIKGGTRLRAMTKQISESLDAVGISSEKMQKDLAQGNMTMLEAVQQVAQKLKEIPENSQEAGNVLKNVFGRSAAEGGMLLVQSIADVNTDLDKLKESMGEWGELQIKQMEAQAELNETIAAVFDFGDKGFEGWIAKGKIYATETLTNIIKKGIEIYNWIVKLYNETVSFRLIVGGIVFTFKALYDIGKGLFDLMIEGFRGMAVGAKGLMQILDGDFKQGWQTITVNAENHFKKLGKIIADTGKEIGKDFSEGVESSINSRLEEIDLTKFHSEAGATVNQGGEVTMPSGNKELSDKEKKELEKAAKEQLKILQQLDESKIALMQDSHEKELATIRLNFRKKLEAIKGDGENEKALRIQLLEQMEKELADCEEKYQKEIAKTNLANRLASVKKGSKEEYMLKLAQLEQSRIAEIEQAEKTGADVTLIEEKYAAKRLEIQEDFAKKQAELLTNELAGLLGDSDLEMEERLANLRLAYSEQLALCRGNEEKMAQIKEEYERKAAEMSAKYAVERAQKTVDALKKILDNENITGEARLAIERRLKDARIDLITAVAVANETAAEKGKDGWQKSLEEIGKAMQKWSDIAMEAMNSVADLVSALYDGQIQKIEQQQEANEEARDAEISRVEELVEHQVITEEEGEARKRAAEAKTAQENEKLEKKKAQLQRKQAIFQKATDMAQAGISTALAIINALSTQPFFPLGLAMAAIAGTMGAIQMATIAATPIPQYKEGTKWHVGGPAIVGDGGKREVVMIGSQAYLTPDTPTLVDLPKGASVYPDVTRYVIATGAPEVKPEPTAPVVHVKNDYTVLERKMGIVAELMRMQLRMQRKQEYDRQYEIFKLTRL